MTYKIVRHYQNEAIPQRVLETGLTLAEAQAHCQDPDTTSKTATSTEAMVETAQNGDWFDGYYRETDET